MPVEYVCLQRSVLDDQSTVSLEKAKELATTLRSELDLRERDIDIAHIHGASSSAIQRVVSEVLTEKLRFREEVILTPQHGFVTQARPDFYFALPDGHGIIAEVERGGTVTNNHDLKDLWKAHIAPDAQHLFLVVPISNWSRDGRPRERPFLRVTHRLRAFFGDPRREVDVISCHIFGYGRATLDLDPEAAVHETT